MRLLEPNQQPGRGTPSCFMAAPGTLSGESRSPAAAWKADTLGYRPVMRSGRKRLGARANQSPANIPGLRNSPAGVAPGLRGTLSTPALMQMEISGWRRGTLAPKGVFYPPAPSGASSGLTEAS